jgi:hypothetical protein
MSAGQQLSSRFAQTVFHNVADLFVVRFVFVYSGNLECQYTSEDRRGGGFEP